MPKLRLFKVTTYLSEDIYNKITYLKGVFGIVKLKDFWNFSMSLLSLITEGILRGEQLALYNPKTDTISIIKHEKITALENMRDEQ